MKTFKNLRDELEEGTSASDRGEPQTPHTKKEYDALSPKDKKIVDARLKAARKQGMSRNPYESPRNYKKRKPKTRRGGVSKYGRGQTGPLPKNEETEIDEGGMGRMKDPHTIRYVDPKQKDTTNISVVDGEREAKKFLAKVKKKGMSGTIKKGSEQPGSIQTVKYNQSTDQLNKASRYDTLTGKRR
jgi:hypothetical protein